jgi:hypothetical protein
MNRTREGSGVSGRRMEKGWLGNAKGTTLINAVKALRSDKNAARALLPEHLHKYLDEPILPFAWYPEEDVLAIVRAVAKVTPIPGVDIYDFMGRTLARTDLEGVYAHLLCPGDPERSLREAAIIWGVYHDTGKVVVVESGDNYVVTENSGHTYPSREICRIVAGWNAELAVMAGGKNVKVLHDECVLEGAKACRFKVSWTN